MKPVYTDYSRSIPSVIASIEQYYGIKRAYKPLDALAPVMNRRYKNVVLLVFDGLGANLIKNTLSSEDFLRKNMLSEITTVFPSTTVAAMTSWYSGASPSEHAWLGWSLFFKELCRCIDVFPRVDSFSQEPCMNFDYLRMIMPYETLMERLYNKNKLLKLNSIFTTGCAPYENVSRKLPVDSIDDMCRTIRQQCMLSGEKFIFGYWTQPDEVLHSLGCEEELSKKCIRDISMYMERLSHDLYDTLLIISADHGMTDIDDEVYINTIPEINECLIMPPSVEARAAAFFVKSNMSKEFESRFKKRLGDDFMLLSRSDVMKRQLLGTGIPHSKVSDFLGDYMAIATGRKIIRYHTANGKIHKHMCAHHAGLTEDEMMIPLVVFAS